MKNKSIYLIIAGMILMTGCSSVPGSSETAPEVVAEEIEAPAAEDANETETTENTEDTSKETSENAETQIANPWKEITEEEAGKHTTRMFKVPDGAQNVTWSMNDSENKENPLIQVNFTLDGLDFTARTQYGAPEYADISGMYYEWTAKDEGKLGGWGSGNMDAKFFRYVGDECADLCTWYDIEIGIAYSLSTTAKDLDGFDIQAVAEAMYPGDDVFYGDF